MINMFIVRKYLALVLSSMLSVISFYVGMVYYSFWFGLIFLFGGLFLGIVIGSVLLKNPFSSMLEGKGILVINLDSTGVLRPFIVKVLSPYIKGVLNGKKVDDVFDRDAVFQMAAPVKGGTAQVDKAKGCLKLELDEDTYNKGRFALFHYPVLLYNEQLRSILTKDELGDKEKNAFAKHGILYLNRKMEELTSAILNFGRHIVDLTKPQKSFFSNKWVIIVIIIIVLVIIGAMLMPMLSKAVAPAAEGAGKALGAITPRG